MVVPLGLVRRFSPIVYLPKEGTRRQLINILCETNDNYAILWFHWPRDGTFQHQDYEPIILVFKHDILYKIGIRPHQRYKSYKQWKTESSRPLILFEGPFHRAIVKDTGMGTGSIFTILARFSTKMTDYQFEPARPPVWYSTDGTDKDVHDYANEISS